MLRQARRTSRRVFVREGGLALISVGVLPGLGPLFIRRAALADTQPAPGKRVLVCLFQRGAVDGLSMVVPRGDRAYYKHRPVGPGGIALPETGERAAIDLDGFFALHPALAALKPIYQAGHLAPIHAVGSPNNTRSHFDAQDFMESGAPGDKSVHDGWLTRALQHCPEDRARRSAFRAVAMTTRLPRSFSGSPAALAIPDLNTFGFGAGNANPKTEIRLPARSGGDPQSEINGDALAALAAAYGHSGDGDVVHAAGKELFDATKLLEKVRAAGYVPANGAQYPRSPVGQALQQIAQLIKAGVGVEIAFTESGGWDTHVNQGAEFGQLAARLFDLGNALAAFHRDMGDRMSEVVVLTMSEFGRTARQNGNGGTDHGHATCFFALGGAVNGGRVLGRWPGLSLEQLYEGRDLAVTTDFRDVFAEVASKHLGIHDPNALFPGYTVDPARFPCVLRM